MLSLPERWMAVARTPDHHPIPMQPTRRGLAPTTISTHCDRTDSRLVDARFGHTNSPDLGRGWMDCAPACRGHQAAFLGPATPFGISRSRSAGRRGNRNLRRPIVALDHSWISPSTIWMAGELAGFWCHIKGESIENAWIRPIEHVVVFAV